MCLQDGTRLYEYNKDDIIMQESLLDVKNGKIVDWKGHKMDSLKLADSFDRLGMGKAERVYQCGDYLEFKVYPDDIKLHKANFCKARLCPMCAWRRSLKVFGQASNVMDYLTEYYGYRYVFLTFSLKNVFGVELSDELDRLFKAFNLMTKRKEFKAISRGWFRCLEVTHNWERDDYHPHFHMVIAVNKSYFKEAGVYLSHEQWTELWKSCAEVDYVPNVWVKAVRPDKGTTDKYSKSVAEVAKYAVKSNDYLVKIPKGKENDAAFVKNAQEKTDRVVYDIDTALHGRRLIAFGGKYKEVHKLLNLDSIEDGDLVHTDIDGKIREDLGYVIARYRWNIGFNDYYIETGAIHK